jgi:hypothetical protein
MIIGIYTRKLIFFSIIGLFIFAGVKLVNQKNISWPKVSASVDESQNTSKSPYAFYLTIDAKDNGSLYINGKKANTSIAPRTDMDELRFVVLSEPTGTYQDVQIVVNLPKKINRLVSSPQIIAVHGATPIRAQLEGDKIVYEAANAGPSSTVTIVAQFPKGYFNLPVSQEIERTFNSISGWVWVIGGVVLPPIALMIVLVMFFGSRLQVLQKHVSGSRDTPPNNITPGLASILNYGHITPHAIMATLIDLAQRGFIEIYNRGDDFVIYRKEISHQDIYKLKPFERILIEKIFLPKQHKVETVDVEARLSRHLFSRKLALVYLGVYEEGKALGYFVDNPARLHLKYRMIGIGSFFLGFFGYLFFAFYSPDPKFVLFLWLSLIVLGVLMINLAPDLTGFSNLGKKVRLEWLKFRNFLEENMPIRGHDELFEQYLPYAVAMGVEAAWAARFVEASFVLPEWYDYAGKIEGAENFAKSLLPIIDFLGESFNASSDPLVR